MDLSTYECKIQERKPIVCKLFPIDEKDIPSRLKGICSYYWDNENK